MLSARPLLLALGAGAVAMGALAAALRAEVDPARDLPGPFRRILVVDFEGEIGSVLCGYVTRHVDRARAAGVDCLVLRIDSPGGTVLHSEKIGDLLVGLPDSIHTVAWIPKQAYSGAAFVALACREIVMGSAAHIGDAQPVLLGPEGITPVGEKIESPLRAKFRDYAVRNGYEPLLAEAMVSASMEVLKVRDPAGDFHYVEASDYREAEPDAEILTGWTRAELQQVDAPVVREGYLLTFTADQAREHGFLRRTFAEGAAHPASEAALLEVLTAEDGTVERVEMSFSERASRLLMGLSGVLSAIVALSLLVFMWQGPGLMTIVGGAALALLILVNVTADQLNGFPLFLILVGALLLAAEVFVIPGFGIAGVLGIAALGAGFLFLAAGFTLDESRGLTTDLAADFGLQFVVTVLGGIGGLFLVSRFLPQVGPARRLMLAAPEAAGAATAAVPAPVRVGQRGRAVSALRPAGTAEFEGRLADVVSEGSFVARGAPVVVVAVEGNRVAVRSLAPEEPDEESGV